MRNFSATSTVSFITGSVNDEYVFGHNPEYIDPILQAIAKAMEAGYGDVARDFRRICQLGSESSWGGRLTASEYRVLAELHSFWLTALDAWGAGMEGNLEPRVFVYTNMNTGHTVTWTVYQKWTR